MDSFAIVLRNHVHDIGAEGIDIIEGLVAFNYLANGTKDFSNAIGTTSTKPALIYRNIIKLDGTSSGIQLNERNFAIQNSIWANAGMGGFALIFDGVHARLKK